MEKLVDDILIMGKTKKELLEGMERVIKHCQEHKITLNDKKIQIGQFVKFGGHVITSELSWIIQSVHELSTGPQA